MPLLIVSKGSLDVKLPIIWTDGKAEVGSVRKEKRREERRSEERKNQKKEDPGARKGRKVAKHCVFVKWFVALEGRRVGSLKRRVRSQLARWEMKNCTPLWHEAHFEVKMDKAPQLRSTFGSWDDEKVRQNVQNTPRSDTFGSWDVEKVHAVYNSSSADRLCQTLSEEFVNSSLGKRTPSTLAGHTGNYVVVPPQI